MTQDQQDLFDQYEALIALAVISETDAAAAMSTYQIETALAQQYRAQAKEIATRLGITC